MLDHLSLPVFYGTKYAKEYTLVEKEHTEEEMQQIMQAEWDKILQTLEEKGVQITRKNVTINKGNDKWILNIKMQLVEEAVSIVNNTTQQIPDVENEAESETEVSEE